MLWEQIEWKRSTAFEKSNEFSSSFWCTLDCWLNWNRNVAVDVITFTERKKNKTKEAELQWTNTWYSQCTMSLWILGEKCFLVVDKSFRCRFIVIHFPLEYRFLALVIVIVQCPTDPEPRLESYRLKRTAHKVWNVIFDTTTVRFIVVYRSVIIMRWKKKNFFNVQFQF